MFRAHFDIGSPNAVMRIVGGFLARRFAVKMTVENAGAIGQVRQQFAAFLGRKFIHGSRPGIKLHMGGFAKVAFVFQPGYKSIERRITVGLVMPTGNLPRILRLGFSQSLAPEPSQPQALATKSKDTHDPPPKSAAHPPEEIRYVVDGGCERINFEADDLSVKT
ncbi:hypothetical protein [Sphingopyxis panaciterrae]